MSNIYAPYHMCMCKCVETHTATPISSSPPQPLELLHLPASRSYAHSTIPLEDHVFINFLCLPSTTSMWLSEDFALTIVLGIQNFGGDWIIIYVQIFTRVPKHQSVHTKGILLNPLQNLETDSEEERIQQPLASSLQTYLPPHL